MVLGIRWYNAQNMFLYALADMQRDVHVTKQTKVCGPFEGSFAIFHGYKYVIMVSRAPQLTRQVKQKIVYRDFNMNLNVSALTGDLIMLQNADAVKQSIRNLVLTYPGERFYQPTVGSTVSRALFEFVDGFSTDQLRDTILSTITNYEPRAQNVSVTVTPYPQNNAYEVDITFSIIALPGVVQNVPTILLPVR